VFDNQLPAALKKLTFDKHLSAQNVRKIVSEADGYQPHLTAPEQGYRCLVESSLILFHGPAEAVVDAVCLCPCADVVQNSLKVFSLSVRVGSFLVFLFVFADMLSN
jgi:hypothetical protein